MIRERENARTRGLEDARTRGLEFSNPRVLESSPPNSGNGFTLMEISIVLVVIAMLLGGTMVGRDLIRSAEIRAIIAEQSNYSNAIEIFRKKYGSLPGDMYNATTYWGAATCPASTGVGTCNGDGDGTIEYMTENYYAWEHLALSTIIPGTYSGIGSNVGGSHRPTIGTDVPASKVTGNYWQIVYFSQLNSVATEVGFSDLADIRNNYLIYSGTSATTWWLADTALSPIDAYNIDLKVDDGLPGYGNTRAGWNSSATSCTTTRVASTAAYVLTKSTNGCLLGFILK